MKFLSKKKKVSPAPDHDPHTEKGAHAITSTESAKSAKTISVAPVKTKSFLGSKKVAPAPDNESQSVEAGQTQTRSASSTNSANGSPSGRPSTPSDRKYPRHADTDLHNMVKVDQDSTIQEMS